MMRVKNKPIRKTEYLQRIMACLVALLVVLIPANAFADNPSTNGTLHVAIDVVIDHEGGIAVIEGTNYVAREDDSQEEIASFFDKRNGSECLPATTQITVPAGGKATFEWDIDAASAVEMRVYSYKITQKPGTDPQVTYDDREYLAEVYIIKDELSGNLYAVTVIRGDSKDPVAFNQKPDECRFVNARDMSINPDTGDNNNMLLYIATMAGAATVAFVLLIGGRKKRKDDEEEQNQNGEPTDT